MRQALCVLALLSTTAATAPAQAPPLSQGRPGATDARSKAETGTARICGRVISVDSGRPLLGARVSATGPGVYPSAGTDRDGRFELRNLPAGAYRLTASLIGYVGLEYKEDVESGGGQDITVHDGETFDKADFTLPRGGVVTGRILDEGGEPIENVEVAAFVPEYVAGKERLRPVPGATARRTNDQGRYRVYGLPPGDYWIVAASGNFSTAGAPSDTSTGFALTYYPGSADLANAQTVKIAAGRETAGIDFGLVRTRAYDVGGVVLDTTGAPIAGAAVVMMPGTEADIAVVARAQTGADGRFTFADIPAGKYLLQTLPLPGAKPVFASAPLAVASKVTDIVLQGRTATTARGQIIVEGAPSFKPRDVRILPRPTDFTRTPIIGSGMLRAEIQDDWSFELRGVIGPVRINAEAPPGWGLAAVRLAGQDVTDKPLDLERDNGAVLQIVLTNQVAELSGSVTDEGQPAGRVPVIVFARDRTRWDLQSRYLRLATTDEQGRYFLSALPPSQYYVVALPKIKAGFGWQQPKFLDALVPLASRITVREAERASADLKMTRPR